jgi:hypothetical protein
MLLVLDRFHSERDSQLKLAQMQPLGRRIGGLSLSNDLRFLKRETTAAQMSETFETTEVVHPVQLAATELRMFHSEMTGETYAFTGKKVINKIDHIQLTNQITGDQLLLTESAILERFSEKEVNTDRITKSSMIKLSRMFQRS